MPSLIDIRRRLRSVRNTQQITKAMKMVAEGWKEAKEGRLVPPREDYTKYADNTDDT